MERYMRSVGGLSGGGVSTLHIVGASELPNAARSYRALSQHAVIVFPRLCVYALHRRANLLSLQPEEISHSILTAVRQRGGGGP